MSASTLLKSVAREKSVMRAVAMLGLTVLALPGLVACDDDDEDTSGTTDVKEQEPRIALALLPVARLPAADGDDGFFVDVQVRDSQNRPAEDYVLTLITDKGAFILEEDSTGTNIRSTTKEIARVRSNDGRYTEAKLKSCTGGEVTVRAYVTIDGRVIDTAVRGSFAASTSPGALCRG